MSENDLAREYSVAHGGPIRNIALERKALTTETVAGQVASILQRYGVDCIFGQSIPTELMLAAEQLGIRQLLYRTENAGGAMADGYARMTHRVGVVAAQNGPADLAGDLLLGARPSQRDMVQ